MLPKPMTWLLSQRDESLFNSWEHCHVQTAKTDNLPKLTHDGQPETRTRQLYIILMEVYLSDFPFSMLVNYIDKPLRK